MASNWAATGPQVCQLRLTLHRLDTIALWFCEAQASKFTPAHGREHHVSYMKSNADALQSSQAESPDSFKFDEKMLEVSIMLRSAGSAKLLNALVMTLYYITETGQVQPGNTVLLPLIQRFIFNRKIHLGEYCKNKQSSSTHTHKNHF